MILRLGTTSPDVMRWQTFLGLSPDGIFGEETKTATKEWQRNHGLDDDGEVGTDTLTVAADNGYTRSANDYYPPRPNFKSPTDDERRRLFGTFTYKKKNATDITITDNWPSKNIVKVKIPQLVGVSGAPANGVIQFHKKGANQIKAFFAEIEDKGLLPLVISWAGSYYPRFIRGSQKTLSNHSWGTAWDINAPENWLGQKPAAVGKKGSLLKLVPIANKHGFFWGGHYNSRLDGMHFELAKVTDFSDLQDDEIILDLDSATATVNKPASAEPTDEEKATTNTHSEPPPIPPIDLDKTKVIESHDTATGSTTTVSEASNVQDVNKPAQVSTTTYQGVGLFGVLKKDFAVVTGGNLSFQGIQEYATQASGWPPVVISIITKLATVAVIAGVAWLLFRLFHYVIWKVGDTARMKVEANINSDVNRKNIEWT